MPELILSNLTTITSSEILSESFCVNDSNVCGVNPLISMNLFVTTMSVIPYSLSLFVGYNFHSGGFIIQKAMFFSEQNVMIHPK